MNQFSDKSWPGYVCSGAIKGEDILPNKSSNYLPPKKYTFLSRLLMISLDIDIK